MARAALIAFLLLPAMAGAQAPAVTLRGVAWDSVASRPLAGAFIVLDGARSTQSDSLGLFAFDTVRLGIREIDMQHAVLDSMGLPGISTRIVLLDSLTAAVVAIPSFPTLWAAACGERPAPADSGFVYGSVRNARDDTEAVGAVVRLSWTDLTLLNVREYRQKRFNVEIEADANGEYAICGVPLDAGLEILATLGDAASAPTAVGTSLRIRRRDLLIGGTDTVTAPRGIVAGTVTHLDGRPFDGATVVLDDAPPQRTGRDGRFSFADILTGTRQIEVLALGSRPQAVPVDVRAGAPTNVLVVMDRLTTLEAVRITGTPWQLRTLEGIAERMAKPHGQYRDSTQLGGRYHMGLVFGGLRGVQVRYSRGGEVEGVMMRGLVSSECGATVYIDGYRETEMIWLNLLKPQDIAIMEVYDRPELVPFRFSSGGGDFCGVVAIWTKGVLP